MTPIWHCSSSHWTWSAEARRPSFDRVPRYPCCSKGKYNTESLFRNLPTSLFIYSIYLARFWLCCILLWLALIEPEEKMDTCSPWEVARLWGCWMSCQLRGATTLCYRRIQLPRTNGLHCRRGKAYLDKCKSFKNTGEAFSDLRREHFLSFHLPLESRCWSMGIWLCEIKISHQIVDIFWLG